MSAKSSSVVFESAWPTWSITYWQRCAGLEHQNVHAAFDELLNGADRDRLRSLF